MPNVADYKVIRENASSLTSVGDTFTIIFDLPAGALLVDNPQRPYITFSESVSGAGPLTVSITLNGASINTHTYSLDPQMATRTVIINGSTFVSGQNTIIFTMTSGPSIGTPGTVTIRDVIVHFQQPV